MKEDLPPDQLETVNHRPRPVILLLIDGWGIDSVSEVNAIAVAKPKHFYNLVKNYPIALLKDDSYDPRRRYWSLGTGQAVNSVNFPQASPCLSEIIAQHNLRQLKISPAHSFNYLNLLFNNYQTAVFPKEERKMIGQGKSEPLEEAKGIIKASQEAIDCGLYDFMAISLPLLDQLSVSGQFKEIVKGVKILDNYLKKISDYVLAANGLLIILSPFGNAEYTKDLAADWLNRGATNNPVPFLIIAKEYLGKTIGLADPLDDDLSLLSPVGDLSLVMPTILQIIDIKTAKIDKNKSLI